MQIGKKDFKKNHLSFHHLEIQLSNSLLYFVVNSIRLFSTHSLAQHLSPLTAQPAVDIF